MDDNIARIDRAAAAADPVMRSIRADQLDLPTPCNEWDMRALLDHLFGNLHRWAAQFQGQEAPEPAPRLADAGTDDDVERAWQAARDPFLAAMRTEGSMERAGMFTTIMPIELMLHGWDAASAAGLATDLDPELAGELLEIGRPLLERFGRRESFAEEQPAPPGSTAADRLAAFYGRRVS